MRRIELAKEPEFEMGGVAVVPAYRQLTASDGGQVVVEHRVMQVLIALADAAGAIVTRDELIKSCWDGRIVGDDAINRVISRLRRTAQELGGDVFRVETINKVGYRLVLIGEPTASDAEKQADASRDAASLARLPTAAPIEDETAAATLTASAAPASRINARRIVSLFRRPPGITVAISTLLILAAGLWLWFPHEPGSGHSMTVRLAGYLLSSTDLPATIQESTNAEVAAPSTMMVLSAFRLFARCCPRPRRRILWAE
ncbi:winged helix-turn-helix domain-containing protein [Novosphingobium sp. 9U]|uniref:winged helix-turn-helix domain-containing protein n=1 Tax=Novosphingobium sp. 9U TaxID=2653158 RepID=UPI0012F022E5|nr:winged helix-turn-helix domain-containing protein [Novosphingobium sp. 9U]VWX48033.1 hypothetical protein NOVOSPHI9U_110008 [Novosphingobium sp. 9U]